VAGSTPTSEEDCGSSGGDGQAVVTTASNSTAVPTMATEHPLATPLVAQKPVTRRLWERALFNQHITEHKLPVKVAPSPHGGDGLFATRRFAKSEKIVQFYGTPCTRDDMVDFRNSVRARGHTLTCLGGCDCTNMCSSVVICVVEWLVVLISHIRVINE
jgi:hypothetical protein